MFYKKPNNEFIHAFIYKKAVLHLVELRWNYNLDGH